MAHERKCTICGKEYRYCPRCDEFKDMPTWMLEFDSENCRKIYYDVVNPFAFKHISKDEAVERLKDCDISGKDSFKPEIKSVLDQLVIVPVVDDKGKEETKDKKDEKVNRKKPFYKPIKED